MSRPGRRTLLALAVGAGVVAAARVGVRPLADWSAAGFRQLSRLRGTRSLHPAGLAYRARLEITAQPGRWPEVPLLTSGAVWPALVRFSRAAGLPDPLPDGMGVGVKLPGAGGDRVAVQDLLVTSSSARPLLRRVLRPATGFLGPSFSSLASFRFGARRLVYGLRPLGQPGTGAGRGALGELRAAAAEGLRYELWVAGTTGPAEPVGVLSIEEPLPAEQAAALRFNPWDTGPGIEPVGWLNELRRPSYAASQEGWLTDPPEPPAG